MKNNVFWGVLGGILFVWLVLFWFLGWSTKNESDAKNEGLTTQVLTLKRLSEKSVSEFPSEDLRALRETELQKMQRSLDDAVAYLGDRDKKLERFLTDSQSPTLVEWEARYKDSFRKLGEEYRAFAGLAADAKLPFSENPGIQNQASLPEYQKRYWGLQAMVRSVMKLPGCVIESLDFEDKPKDLGRLDRSELHDRKQWRLDASLSATQIPVLVNDLLTHEFVTFELQRLVATKSQGLLKPTVVEVHPKGELVGGEPPVRIRLIVNALDWKYVPPQSDAN